jgi:tRNA pseudouridine(55) synthase
VVDAQDGRPLAGVTLVLLGTQLGAHADAEGRFLLRGAPAGPGRLLVSHVGYQPLEVAVVAGSGIELKIELQVSAVELPGVVVSATRRAQEFLQCDKSYLAAVRLGKTTDTQDAEGKVLTEREVGPLAEEEIEEACRRFRGEIEQEIPAYSAVRIQGKRSYALARAGLAVPRRSRRIRIDELKILAVRLPEVELKVTCSSGTYIRALASALGEALGCGAHLARLRRIRVGSFTIDQAVKLDEAESRHLLGV